MIEPMKSFRARCEGALQSQRPYVWVPECCGLGLTTGNWEVARCIPGRTARTIERR